MSNPANFKPLPQPSVTGIEVLVPLQRSADFIISRYDVPFSSSVCCLYDSISASGTKYYSETVALFVQNKQSTGDSGDLSLAQDPVRFMIACSMIIIGNRPKRRANSGGRQTAVTIYLALMLGSFHNLYSTSAMWLARTLGSQ